MYPLSGNHRCFAMSSGAFKTLTLDSTALYATAHTTVFSQPPSLPLPLPPPPTSLPHPKIIPKTRFIVDGFKHAGDFSVSYFLSHFHSDHYTGLTPFWSKGVIFCSSTTARLLTEVLKVPAPFVMALPLDECILIDGSEVFLLDANHCPGAVQFLFRVRVDGGKVEKFVHTGDFRFCDSMKSLPVLNEFVGADAIFLDTTYCNPKFLFPSQEESIDYIVGVINRILVENEVESRNVLFLVATYVIGKEKVLVEISRKCNRKIHVDDRKMEVLSVLGLGECGVFTREVSESDVHVVGWNVLGETWPYFRPNFVRMEEIMEERGYSKVVGFVPTGWTYEVKKNKFAVRRKDSFEIYLVPYSEHSNYDELREFVKFLKPKHVIPTVGMDVEKVDSKQASALRKHFAALVDVTAVKKDFLMGFHRWDQEIDENNGRREADEMGEADKEGGGRELDEKDGKSCTPALKVLQEPWKGVLLVNECRKDMDVADAVNSSVLLQESAAGGNAMETQVDIEEFIKDLMDCLPSWVTRDQMLDLFSSSGRNVVEAVSKFYEHETEFHEQVNANESTTSKSLAAPQFEPPISSKLTVKGPGLPSLPCYPKDLHKSEDASSSKKLNIPGKAIAIKSGLSPGKRKRTPEKKTIKKIKSFNSNLESSGSKQCSITKFFHKLPLVPINAQMTAEPKQSQDDDIMPLDDTTERYKAKVDQFIQIVNGDGSLKSYATSILDEAKGDINVALDLYYSNSSSSIN